MKYYANDKYDATLSQGHIFGDPTFYVSLVPDHVPTIITLAVGTEFEAVYKVTGKTLSSLTGCVYLRGYAGDHDGMTPLTILNNEDFINQYAEFAGIIPKGDYDNATAYITDDLVYYQGSGYVAKQATTGNLPTDTTYWMCVVQKGDQGIQGIQGIQGVQGEPGLDGLGVPAGGATGEVLKKKSNANNDTEWGSIVALPTGGTTGQILAKKSNTNGDAEWVDKPKLDFLLTQVFS